MDYLENWEQTKERMLAFWQKDCIDRACLAITVPKNHWQGETLPDLTGDALAQWYTDPEAVYTRELAKSRQFHYFGEGFPSVYPNFGTAGHAAYAGAKPNYRPDTIWFEPALTQPDVSALCFEGCRPIHARHVSFVQRLAALSQGKFFTGMPDNCGIIDALAELRGSDNLLYDFIEEPEFVAEARVYLTELWKRTTPAFFDAIRENNGGSIHSWMKTWSPGRHAQIQCDFSVMISTAHFERFVLPELEETSAFLDHASYHLDGQEQVRHLDMILSVKTIDNIQWTAVAGQPKPSAFLPVLQRIQKAGKGLIILPQPDEVETLLENLSPKGLLLVVDNVPTTEAAQWMLRRAAQLAQ